MSAVVASVAAEAAGPDFVAVAEQALALANRLEAGEIRYPAAEDVLAPLLAGPTSRDLLAAQEAAAQWLRLALYAREAAA